MPAMAGAGPEPGTPGNSSESLCVAGLQTWTCAVFPVTLVSGWIGGEEAAS